MEQRWNDTDRFGRNTRREICPSVTLSAIYPAWTDLGASPGLCGENVALSMARPYPERPMYIFLIAFFP
jgi:hypothetical protein